MSDPKFQHTVLVFTVPPSPPAVFPKNSSPTEVLIADLSFGFEFKLKKKPKTNPD